MKIKIFSTSKHELPKYATPQSAGLDLRANIDESVTLRPGERTLIPTGIHIQLPVGYEAQVRGRSGLAVRNGVTVHLGTIDADYRGDIGVIIVNLGQNDFVINDGDRIAQMVIAKHEVAEWEPVDNFDHLTTTERATEGFGHTGVH